ncbi:MAG: chromosome partitioning protein ParA [Oscillospiraceae bacterium]|jgi:hypothetical protein|nr:chromosome partitioning protein ParA [Oscillospiraceae bacterium]
MKVKLAILHSDSAYLNRLTSVLEANYKEKLALYSFTDAALALSALGKEKVDVFLADDSFEIDLQQLPAKCAFAYFVDSPEIDTCNGSRAICRFQRTELLYKQILGLFSDVVGRESVRNIYSSGTKLLIFSSPCGGTGTSTLAAACALHFATAGKRSLYLNFERFGGADAYFGGEGHADMSDVIYAVKSGRGNLAVKLESCVRQDSRGVSYFSSAKAALDVMELTVSEKVRLVSELISSGSYDYIVIDMDFDLSQSALPLFQPAHALVWISDGVGVSNGKIMRAYEALCVQGNGFSPALADRVCLIQNKCVGAEGAMGEIPGIRSAGTIAKIRHRMEEQITASLAGSEVFDKILA